MTGIEVQGASNVQKSLAAGILPLHRSFSIVSSWEAALESRTLAHVQTML